MQTQYFFIFNASLVSSIKDSKLFKINLLRRSYGFKENLNKSFQMLKFGILFKGTYNITMLLSFK